MDSTPAQGTSQPAGPSYERYVEVFAITERRDGCTYATESRGCGWYPEDVIKANRPAETNLDYVAASDEFANTHMTIRLKRP